MSLLNISFFHSQSKFLGPKMENIITIFSVKNKTGAENLLKIWEICYICHTSF